MMVIIAMETRVLTDFILEWKLYHSFWNHNRFSNKEELKMKFQRFCQNINDESLKKLVIPMPNYYRLLEIQIIFISFYYFLCTKFHKLINNFCLKMS